MTIERLERRCAHPSAKPRVETRADGNKVIVGYGAVFYREGDAGTEYKLWRGLVERVSAAAFTRALAERQDVRGLFNHDASRLLGRTASNTLRLSIDQVGLRYEIDAADTQDHRDLLVRLERGDIDGSSFGFSVRRVSYTLLDDDTDIRTIEEIETLYDVGPVTFPAYTATSAGVRSGDRRDCEDEWKQWRAQHRPNPRTEADAVAVRMQLARLID